MAKDEMHSWGRTIMTVLTLAFFCGVTYRTTGNNTDGVEENREGVVKLVESVHQIELNHKDTQALTSQSVKYMALISSQLRSIQKEQTDQGKIIAVNSTKLESLTKD